MMDNASPRDGWSNLEHSKHSVFAKSDAFGAVFALLRDLLLKFCERVTKVKLSFELYCVNAMEIATHVGARRFDRIEVSVPSQYSCGANYPRSQTFAIAVTSVHNFHSGSSLRF